VRLGIDFGTTHTVVALVDRGNYPVVSFEGSDFVPSLVAARDADGALRFGLDAAAVRHEPGWSVLKSFKRLLNDAGPGTEAEIGERRYPLATLLTGFLARLKEDLLTRSNSGLSAGDPMETAVSVPANASSAQRFLMLDAFRRAGFPVVALLNEPSAAGFEYAQRFRATLTAKKEYVVVYDLGGGTFDASLLRMTGKTNEVVSTSGVRRLGGDDFDEAILQAVLKAAGVKRVARGVRPLLLEECARQKEAVGPNTRRFPVDLSALSRDPVSLPIEEIWEACSPLAEKTLRAIEPLFESAGPDETGVTWSEVAGLYVVGGAGAFPLVARLLKERFGEKRIRRSPHPFAATAIGLAIFLDRDAGWTLSERLTRHFGVFRETASGADIAFDPIFVKDTPLPRPGEPPLVAVRCYRAAHNLGHFRYLECSRVKEDRPDGDVTPWDEIRFPFDRGLRDIANLDTLPVVRREAEGPEVEEAYVCGADGAITVTLTNRDDGFTRTFRLKR
jgi:molecular chaperone DnaK (HSP70)